MESKRSQGDQDPFEDIANTILATLKNKGGIAHFSELEKWEELANIGKYTLRTIVNELIGRNRLKAPEGFYDAETDIEPPVPKVVQLPRFSPSELERLKEYLREYRSVGLLRLFEDLSRAGVKEVNEVLKEAIDEGYAELTPSSVVNATQKLLKE
ncbi:MAG: hypothetical protein ACUVQ5_05905 [Candidatus Methanomethylicaceae archaeon]